MRYVFKFQVEAMVEDGPEGAELRPLGNTTLTLRVNAEDLENAKVKASRALQAACYEASGATIFYTHDR